MTARDSLSLPTGPFEHAAMDYARLREEGLQLLGQLAGAQWSDFNTHDPGVTILEQLCYAITDLGYRIDHPMADLLAGEQLELGLPGPAAMLTGDPVTATDLRKFAFDVEGIANAWVEPRTEPELRFHHHPGSRELRLRPEPGEVDAAPVRLRGLDRVLLHTSEALSGVEALARVADRLHPCRGLAADFELTAVGFAAVTVEAVIEVGPIEDPATVMAEIIEQIETCLAPPVRFAELDVKERLDELLEGPRLEHGTVLGPLPKLRRTVFVSDLIHAITEVSAVRAVRSLAIRGSSGELELWALELGAGAQIATLASDSKLELQRAGLRIAVDPAQLDAQRARRRLARIQPRAADPLARLQPAPGRDRKLARHRSIQHQLPATYGVGELGLPASASVRRRAQAQQLEGYLLLFDQLLANAFAQLAHARELLSPGQGSGKTYFAAPVEDSRELLLRDFDDYRRWLEANVTPGGAELDRERHKRFLAHLLARFGEQLGDHASIDARQQFLRDYPRLSGARGTGLDIFGGEQRSALEERIHLKLGLGEDRRFHLVEHLLLRPIAEDMRQLGDEEDPPVPLLAGVDRPDPWSLQVSYVFRDTGNQAQTFEQRVAQTILQETPAHLIAHLHWFGDGQAQDDGHWTAFNYAWAAFRVAYAEYRRAQLSSAEVATELHVRVRDARDRVIDLLGFGRTYPIRDLPLPSLITVGPNQATTIPLALSQQGVIYELRDRRTGIAIANQDIPIAVVGTGGPISLPTPPIVEDVSYRILAVKLHDGVRHEAWLHGAITIEEGIDTSLTARIRLVEPVVGMLDLTIDNPQPSDARLVDWGTGVEVEVEASQEGVEYELLDAADEATVVSIAKVIGTGGTIVLKSKAFAEDVDLRVRGRRDHAEAKLLIAILPLRVRAKSTISIALVAGAVVDHGAGATLRSSGSQASASYRAFRRRVRDAEFVFATPSDPTIDLDVGGRTVRVRDPQLPLRWPPASNLAAVGAEVSGTGGTVELPLEQHVEDTLWVVQASKLHRRDLLKAPPDPLLPPIRSAVRLDKLHVQLVRPDPNPTLRLRVELQAGATVGPLLVEGGQPGVFYRLQPSGLQPLAELAYAHQRDDVDAKLNKGIDQLRIGVDFVLARTPTSVGATLATTPPASPLLDSPALAVGTKIVVLARRAMTELETTLPRTATIAAVPKIVAKQPSVKVGEATQIVIDGSVASERYRLLRDDQIVAEANGTGATLELGTGPIDQSIVFQVAVIADEPSAIAVERRVRVAISVI
jgi:hypothetical protein